MRYQKMKHEEQKKTEHTQTITIFIHNNITANIHYTTLLSCKIIQCYIQDEIQYILTVFQ